VRGREGLILHIHSGGGPQTQRIRRPALLEADSDTWPVMQPKCLAASVVDGLMGGRSSGVGVLYVCCVLLR
jgi:hypothetical protein